MALLTVGARASLITDPDIGIEDGAFSDPIRVGTTFTPINGGGVFGFFNPSETFFIVKLAFQVPIAGGLSQQLIDANFRCESDPFFLGCFFLYSPTAGTLDIEFSGTGLEGRQGIPPLPPGCAVDPHAPGCGELGHFGITLNDRFALTGASGGWSQARNPVFFPFGDPTFTTTEVQFAPEPSSALLAAGALLAILGVRRFRRRSQ
jgi:hypothetical protein